METTTESKVDQIIEAWERCEQQKAIWPMERFKLWMSLGMSYSEIEAVVSSYYGKSR